MRLDEVKEIIRSEGLEDYNINLDHEIEAGEIAIAKKDGKWRVGIAVDFVRKGTKMKAIAHDLEVLIKEMNAVDQMDDDLFIQYFEKEEAMQERLEALKVANKLTAEEYENYSGRLVEAFGRLKGKLSFCNLG